MTISGILKEFIDCGFHECYTRSLELNRGRQGEEPPRRVVVETLTPGLKVNSLLF
jgi:hypothetical protein